MMQKILRKLLEMVIARLKQLPPYRVYVTEGIGPHFWLNLALTWLGYWPGELHALWLSRQDGNHDRVAPSNGMGAAVYPA